MNNSRLNIGNLTHKELLEIQSSEDRNTPSVQAGLKLFERAIEIKQGMQREFARREEHYKNIPGTVLHQYGSSNVSRHIGMPQYPETPTPEKAKGLEVIADIRSRDYMTKSIHPLQAAIQSFNPETMTLSALEKLNESGKLNKFQLTYCSTAPERKAGPKEAIALLFIFLAFLLYIYIMTKAAAEEVAQVPYTKRIMTY